MDDANRRLDGNVAAGLLAECFAFDVTSATAICAGCGDAELVGNLLAYGLEMGVILRCPGCDKAMIRISRLNGASWFDMTGTHVLRVSTETA